jgi:phosphoglucomutase
MIGVVLHEALHFAFFDYCDRFLSEETREFKKNQGILWELSEIFNVIVLNSEEFQAILKRKEKNFYPALEKNFLRMRQLRIRSKKDVSEFVIKGLKTLSKNEKKD